MLREVTSDSLDSQEASLSFRNCAVIEIEQANFEIFGNLMPYFYMVLYFYV